MTNIEAIADTDTEFQVRLITFDKSAKWKVSRELLRINIKGIKNPRPKGIKQRTQKRSGLIPEEVYLIFNCVFLL
jgi:hypothetical protein